MIRRVALCMGGVVYEARLLCAHAHCIKRTRMHTTNAQYMYMYYRSGSTVEPYLAVVEQQYLIVTLMVSLTNAGAGICERIK